MTREVSRFVSAARSFSSASARPWRLVIGVSALSGVAQMAILRELAASHALSTLGLSIRLMIAAVLAAYGIGAALVGVLRNRDPARAYCVLGAGLTLYLLALLFGFLRLLEPELAAQAIDAPRLLVLGLLVAPPFVICGLVIAHLTGEIHARTPERLGPFVGSSLLGTLLGFLLAYHFALGFGVNALLLLAALIALPVLIDRPALATIVLIVLCVLPAEPVLEGLRRSRPGFHEPVDVDNTTRVYSGWSPHQKIDLYEFEDEILLGFYNGFWQWWAAARTDHPHAFPGYAFLYDSAWVEGRDVLVIGSGAGMGLLYIEKNHPRSLTAIEIDPLVVELSRDHFADFNDHVYDRVPVYAMDGRAYLDATDQEFDLIIYEGSFLSAAHPRVAVSAENHLYTVEGIRSALSRMRADALGIVLFAGPDQALRRVASALAANEVPVAGLRLSYEDTLWWELPVLIFGRERQHVEAVVDRILERARDGRRARRMRVSVDATDAVTDARPFLYAGAPSEMRPLAITLAAAGLLAMVGVAAPGRRRVRVYYLVIGAAFMLVQYGLLSIFRSFFGDPISTSYSVLLLLLAGMAIGSARLQNILALPGPLRGALVIGAVGCAALAVVALPSDLGLSSWLPRFGIAAVTLLPLGVLLGTFFPLGLRGEPESSVAQAYVFDALGTVVGFLLFPLIALPAGIPAALGCGALAYALAWFTRPRR